jgi:hypothetical protein
MCIHVQALQLADDDAVLQHKAFYLAHILQGSENHSDTRENSRYNVDRIGASLGRLRL